MLRQGELDPAVQASSQVLVREAREVEIDLVPHPDRVGRERGPGAVRAVRAGPDLESQRALRAESRVRDEDRLARSHLERPRVEQLMERRNAESGAEAPVH